MMPIQRKVNLFLKNNFLPFLFIVKWMDFVKTGKLPTEFIHNTGSVNIFAGYLGLFLKIHDNINKFIENFQTKTEEVKESQRIFNILHTIGREYFALHTSHPKIIHFDWKTRFGTEPPDMFDYNAREPPLKPSLIEYFIFLLF